MKITVLDGNALNPGDLSWSPLEKFGELTVFPRTEPEDVINRIGDSEIILLNKINITENILNSCKSLKYIGVQATGYNVIDIEACKWHGVTVTNVPSYSTAGVAQLTFAFITEFACHTKIHSDSVMAGDWCKSPDFCYWKLPLTELEGKVLGILGYGNIGSRVAQIGKAFGMKIIVCSRSKKNGVDNVTLEELLSMSDFITLHAPLTKETSKIINKDSLKYVKKTSYIINTARGGLVDEEAIRDALDSKAIAGYAADSVSEEPMKSNNPLLGAPNCLLTPHIAWAATETRQRLLNIVVENIEAWLNNKKQNVIV